jgi:putative two-component system response regulator
VLTADATRGSRDQALSSGAHDYLTKPFDPAEVLLRVRNLLETRRLHQELRLRRAWG